MNMVCLMVFLNLLCVFTRMVSSKFTTTAEEIKNVFGTKKCIEGSLSTVSVKSAQNYLFVEDLNGSVHFGNVSSSQDKFEKSAMSRLHELAQYNEIKYFYKLEKEEGPSNNKLFTISLKLGDEVYVSEGTTLKKAQHNVADIALEQTNYEPPPFKEKEQNTDALTPTVLLNNLGAKLGIQITYYLVDKDRKGMLNTNLVIDGKLKKSYLQKLNESIYSDTDIHIRKDEPQSNSPFKVMVEVGDEAFYGVSYTIQSARHEAATKAVDHLVKTIQEGNFACVKEECKEAKSKIKSPISLIYEAAQLRNLDVTFEIVKEEGPSHKKVFTMQCQLGHLITTGEGMSKKESKKNAANNMLNKLSELPEVPQEVLVKSLLKEKQKTKKKKKNKVLKTKFDMINMHIDNFIDSVLESVPISNSKTETPKNNPKQSDLQRSFKDKPSGKSYQDKILEVSNLLNFEVQFLDIDDEGHFSILSLHINPDHICVGKGPSTKIARNKAAESGLKLLQDISLESHFKEAEYSALESDVKKRIHFLLNQDVSEEK